LKDYYYITSKKIWEVISILILHLKNNNMKILPIYLTISLTFTNLFSIGKENVQNNEKTPDNISSLILLLNKNEVEKAINIFFNNSYLQNEKNKKSSLIKKFNNYKKIYGKINNYYSVGEFSITKNLKRYYGILNYEKHPVYMKFNLYLNNNGKWVITEYKLSLVVEEIIPKKLLLK